MGEQNYKGQLIRHCDLSGLTFRFDISKTGPPHDPSFTSYVFVNNERRGEGQDKTRKAAENLACKMALISLQTQDPGNHEQAQPIGPSASTGTPIVLSPRDVPVNGATYANYIGLLNEFCQGKKLSSAVFVDVRRGPPHMPEFFCNAVIDEMKFPEATGKNKKEAKQNAAHLALQVLKRKYPEDLQVPGLDDVEDDVEEAEECSSKSESSIDSSSSSSAHGMENKPSLSESSDSQVTFRSSGNGTPLLPSRPQRRIELAANFMNPNPQHYVTTEDKIFHQDFDNITMIGSGGYGTVYKARKKMDQRYYVVKKVKRRSEKDENEIKTLAQLEQHKNIVRYYHSWAGEDIFRDQSSSGRHKVETLFIQMEWCSKGTLENWIKKMEIIDKCKSLQIFRQILDGVEYIHSNNLIHRDLKPANILFAEDMTVKIADFGLVTQISGTDKDEPFLRTVGRGTENYMAPEQENATYENEVDIFPLGLILIELFWKFDAKYKYEEWEKLRNAELPPKFVQKFPSEEQIIKLMLSKNPMKRPKASDLKMYFGENSVYQSNTR